MIKKTSHLRRQDVEKEAIYDMMNEKGNSKRYLISQKWLLKWDQTMNSPNPLVESNIKNLA